MTIRTRLSPLAAQSDSPAVTVEDEITVTATRSPRLVKDTPGAVSVISEEEIDRELMTNVADLVRFEPGVYVDSDLNRLGLGGFNIRGIGGNRVLTRVDGIATAERFELGPLAVPQYALDLSALKSVEIVRSAGSALYGSDALGGVVTLLTKDPADYLSILGGRSYVEARAGYAGRNRERFESGALALGGDRWQGSLFAARSDGHEMENQGTAPNPQDNNATNVLGKLVYAPGASSSLKLAGEVYRAEAATQVFSSQVGSVIDFDADDEKRRDRISLEQTFVTTGPSLRSFRRPAVRPRQRDRAAYVRRDRYRQPDRAARPPDLRAVRPRRRGAAPQILHPGRCRKPFHLRPLLGPRRFRSDPRPAGQKPRHRRGRRLSWTARVSLQVGELATTLTAAKDEDDIDRTTVQQFATPGFEVVDLTWFLDATEHVGLTLGVFNLFDETYWTWPDVIGRTQGAAGLDRFTRPGRSFSASLRLRR